VCTLSSTQHTQAVFPIAHAMGMTGMAQHTFQCLRWEKS
jgi:hypothetical protein